MLAGSMVSLLQ